MTDDQTYPSRADDDVVSTGVIDRLEPSPGQLVGSLAGVSLGVKEIVRLAGRPLTANTNVELPARTTERGVDAVVVDRLRSAGAFVTAATVSHEFAWGITTYGTGRRVVNPSMPGRIAGGSSGGSAVATARGLVEVGVGTDTAGSCRIPAAWCGVFGWKASAGLVPMDGILPLAPGLDHVGLLAAEFDVLTSAVAALGAPPSSISKVAVVEPGTADRAARDALRAAVDRLRASGVDVRPARFPEPAELIEAFVVGQGVAALRVHRDVFGTWPAQRNRYGPAIVERLEAAERLNHERIGRAIQVRRRVVDALRAQTEDQVVLSVAVGCAPPTIGAPDIGIVDGVALPLRSVVLPHTVHANLAGLPAVVVPWRVRGEEVGVQLSGPLGADLAVLDVASLLCARQA